jgi:hypothetical protein
MNLSSLSDADLKILLDAVMDSETEAANAVAGAVLQEQGIRSKSGAPEIQIGWQIEVFEDNKWKTLDKSDVSSAVFSRFYGSMTNAEQAMARINVKIKERRFEYRTRQYKRGEYRFVQVTTIRKVA